MLTYEQEPEAELERSESNTATATWINQFLATGILHHQIIRLYKLEHREAMLTCKIGARIEVISHLLPQQQNPLGTEERTGFSSYCPRSWLY